MVPADVPASVSSTNAAVQPQKEAEGAPCDCHCVKCSMKSYARRL